MLLGISIFRTTYSDHNSDIDSSSFVTPLLLTHFHDHRYDRRDVGCLDMLDYCSAVAKNKFNTHRLHVVVRTN